LQADQLLRERSYPIDVTAAPPNVRPHVAAIGSTQARKRLHARWTRPQTPPTDTLAAMIHKRLNSLRDQSRYSMPPSIYISRSPRKRTTEIPSRLKREPS
jgi:hypothetical protein